MTKNLSPNYGIIKISSKNELDLITIGDKSYKNTTIITDTLFTGTYPIIAKHNQFKKRKTVLLGEGKTENVKIKFRSDIFILANASFYQPKGPDTYLYGMTFGLCGIQGGYISIKYGQNWVSDGYERTTALNISGGYLRKINKWLYLQTGIGYSDTYWGTYDKQYASSTGKGNSEVNNIFIEGGVIFRLGNRFLLSLNGARGFGKNFSSTYTGGIGFVL